MKKNRRKRRAVRKRSFKDKVKYAQKLKKRMTPAEQKLWYHLKRENKIGDFQFKTQEVVIGYIPDFIEMNSLTVIEVDGPIHRYTKKRDAHRTLHLRDAGWEVIRFTNAHVLETPKIVVGVIKEFCEQRSYELSCRH